MFFKGYVETKNKQCIEKFKNRTDFKNYDQVKYLPEFAGILSDDTVLVDVDDFEQSETLLRIVEEKQLICRVYKTTRGKHFIFKNPGTVTQCSGSKTKPLACGLRADVKIGSHNSYEVLKFNGVSRTILYDKTENEEAEDIPKWLIPIKSNMSFLDMDEGDGRNSVLFSYILTLQSNDFSVEEARETIRIINQYVLKKPLSESELQGILRDDAFDKPMFFKGTTFLFDKFSTFLKNNHHIIRINGQLHLYKDGIYTPGQAELESAMISHIPSLNRAKRAEVLSYLDILVRENTPAAPPKFIAFRNGIYDLKDGSFTGFSPEIVITNKIPWDYNDNAHSDAIDQMLDNVSCRDKKVRKLLEEIVGACMYRSNTLAGGKAFILTGTGSNGKSTYLKTLSNLLAEQNICSLDLKKLDDRFSTVMMFGKLANIGDDISNEFVCDTATFKKLVTGETIDAEQKGQPKFDFKPYCKLLFSANNIPRMGKGSDNQAIMRRLIIVPFDARFSSDDPSFRPEIEYELQEQEAMEYLIQLGISGLRRVVKNKKYTTSEKVETELEEYAERNNPILMFMKDCDDEDFNIDGQSTSEVYDRYREFCLSENLQALSKIEFSRQMTKNYSLKIISRSVNNKKYRIFVKAIDKTEEV